MTWWGAGLLLASVVRKDHSEEKGHSGKVTFEFRSEQEEAQAEAGKNAPDRELGMFDGQTNIIVTGL